MLPKRFRPAFLLILIALAACGPAQATEMVSTSTSTALPTPAPSITPFPVLAATATAPAFQTCSPLNDVAPEQIPTLVTNPYNPPPPGRDDPHAGVDLADMIPGSRVAVSGRAVHAVLSGEVAAVVRDRFPFGNALIVETPLDALPASFLQALPVPTLAPTPAGKRALVCPAFKVPAAWDFSRRSLYLLYAHMQEDPAFQPGDKVQCGQALGKVGKSGNALNPHLHLEARVGPAGARLGSLSHYIDSATLEELSAYCTWATSGMFQVMDPLRLFGQP